MQHMENIFENAEGCSSHNNVSIIGIPEGLEGKDATIYIGNWLKTNIVPGILSPYIVLE